jgi:hypothetical protein
MPNKGQHDSVEWQETSDALMPLPSLVPSSSSAASTLTKEPAAAGVTESTLTEEGVARFTLQGLQVRLQQVLLQRIISRGPSGVAPAAAHALHSTQPVAAVPSTAGLRPPPPAAPRMALAAAEVAVCFSTPSTRGVSHTAEQSGIRTTLQPQSAA